ncbi:MAG TPA: hypothetical protein DIW36_00330 [Ruminococcaceae bacterium]|nr:hypothetical protein [Oscillospiraceae bacterium]
MACFAVPVVEAVVVTAAYAIVKNKEEKKLQAFTGERAELEEMSKNRFSRKLSWLMKMLFGGSFLLAFEHLWHGEIVPWFPFLTAAADPGDRAQMLYEMSTVGVMMAVSVTLVWGAVTAASYILERRSASVEPAKESE